MSDSAEYEVAAREAFASDGKTELRLDSLGAILQGQFSKAVVERRETEERWLMDLRQYRGKYEPTEIARMGERSQAFMRKTRVKIKTIDSRVADLLFPAGSEKNWSVDPTPKPMISDDVRAQIVQGMLQAAQQAMAAQQQAQAQQQPPQGPDAAPPAGAFHAAPGAQPGPGGPAPGGPPLDENGEPPKDVVDAAIKEFVGKAAKAMSTTIEDQLTEARYKEVCVKAVHSGHLYGTGVLKGPLVERKVRTRFEKTMVEVQGPGGQTKQVLKWVPKSEYYVVPFVEYVPLWRFYPDMAATELENCRYVFERHFLNRQRMVELSKNKSFKGDLIIAHLKSNPTGSRSMPTQFDNDLKQIGDRATGSITNTDDYEVLERWGWLTGAQLKETGMAVDEARLEEAFFTNVWLLHTGAIIKIALQPIDGTTWPYHLYSFDKDETSIFGEGLASVMRDDQKMLNAAIRLMLDNSAITSGAMLEIFTELLASTEKLDEIGPWKIFKRNSVEHANVPAVRPINLPNNQTALAAMAQMFESNVDEVTAIPRYMSGENATQGAAGTAAGMSMLMAAANIVIKDLITAWDEGVTRPFLQAMYHWNMKFNPDDEIKGDFDVKARGTASLIAKEVRARSLDEFSNLVANPMDAPYIKRQKLLQQRAEAHELSEIVMTEEEFEQQQQNPDAQQQKQLAQALQQAQLAELQAKVAKMTADSEVANTKVKEILANIDLIVSKTVSTSIESVFAALQAGGTATRDPLIAPAGDEILRSAGWVDKTPNPSIAELNGPPVQQQQSTERVMGKGEAFAADPRVAAPAGPGVAPGGPDRTGEVSTTNHALKPGEVDPAAAGPHAEVKPQTGMVGRRAGIETARIEQ